MASQSFITKTEDGFIEKVIEHDRIVFNFLNKDHQLHRMDGPAVRVYNLDETLDFVEYHIDGVRYSEYEYGLIKHGHRFVFELDDDDMFSFWGEVFASQNG